VSEPATLEAHAKLTLSLSVTGVRPDGMHELVAEMVTLDLHDTLDISDGEGLEMIDAVQWWGAAPVSREPEGSAGRGENLVSRALALCGRNAAVRLTKRIPSGAGLGGGSADAAAVLRWAGWADLAAAAALGADVPFCLAGGRAVVRGIGEVVEGLDVGEAGFLLVTPGLHVSTPAVYRMWDELGGPAGDHGNDLEPAALAAFPGIRWWRDALAAASGERPRLAGSGGTWFVEGEPHLLQPLAEQVRAEVVAGRESAFVTVARAVPG
jgi:4-diphosphocytidyl-2-C-methyl-D-erythritol kinase